MFTIRGCFRSICNHPFLVIIMCLLIFLNRLSPFIFSLLVSMSPVLVSTALLLGTLLSFGQSENEIEIRTTHDCVFAKTEVSNDATIIEQNVKKTENKTSLDVELGNGEISVGNSTFDDIRYNRKTESNEERFSDGEVVEDNSSYVSMTTFNDEHLETEDGESEADSFDSRDSPRSPWKRMKTREDNDDDDDELDSGSDGGESSSPDESTAEIMPMLDELHPLLDEDDPQTSLLSRNGSVAPSVRSPKSSIASNDSGYETENNEEVKQEEQEDETKSVITWTDEDQKNLIDLGSLEIERNQRLENLIMKRRARKITSMIPDINLIDFESCDFQPNVGPVATRRQNPFDFPHDNCPVPGSAPSILLPRRNPFDIPYDPSEENPNLNGDVLQEKPFFRRHESFSVGPSIFTPSRQNERRDVEVMPFFVPERVLESELSESKLSSVAETESPGSVEDIEEHKLAKEQENEAILKNEVIENDVEPEVIANLKHVTEQIGHGSRSSSEESLELGQVEKRDIENHYQEGIVGTAQRHSRGSSSSSLSKVSENEELSILNGKTECVISTLVDEVTNKEPVYDSSPPSVKKNLSASSSSDDVYAESTNLSLPPVFTSRKLETLSENEVISIKEHDEKISSDKKIESCGDKNVDVLSPNSDDVFHEANEKLTCTPTSTPMFYDKGMHEPSQFEHHLEEVQVPNTPVGFEEVQNFNRLNIPEIQDLDLDITNITSPLSPDFISIPSTVPSKANSQIDMHTILEVGNEMNEIDDHILSELENVRDFNITRWGSCPNEFEKHIDSIGESSLSSTEVVELKHLEDLRAEIDMEGPDSESDSEVEAQKVEDADVSVKQSSDKDIKKPIIVEPAQDGPVTGKTIAENSENRVSERSRNTMAGPSNETPDNNARSIEVEAKTNTDIESVKDEGKSDADNVSVTVESLKQDSSMLDGKTDKQIKAKTSDDLTEVEADKVGSS